MEHKYSSLISKRNFMSMKISYYGLTEEGSRVYLGYSEPESFRTRKYYDAQRHHVMTRTHTFHNVNNFYTPWNNRLIGYSSDKLQLMGGGETTYMNKLGTSFWKPNNFRGPDTVSDGFATPLDWWITREKSISGWHPMIDALNSYESLHKSM